MSGISDCTLIIFIWMPDSTSKCFLDSGNWIALHGATQIRERRFLAQEGFSSRIVPRRGSYRRGGINPISQLIFFSKSHFAILISPFLFFISNIFSHSYWPNPIPSGLNPIFLGEKPANPNTHFTPSGPSNNWNYIFLKYLINIDQSSFTHFVWLAHFFPTFFTHS